MWGALLQVCGFCAYSLLHPLGQCLNVIPWLKTKVKGVQTAVGFLAIQTLALALVYV